MNRWRRIGTAAVVLSISSIGSQAARAQSDSGEASTPTAWPVQRAPRGLVELPFSSFNPVGGRAPEGSPEHMLAESLAGLAAAAVNAGKLDELVWIKGNHQQDYGPWHDDLVRRLHLQDRGSMSPWQLLDRYKARGLVKGYVLYSFDASPRPRTPGHHHDNGGDDSINVATSVAGVVNGVLISTDLEPQAKAAGLHLLFDARGRSSTWCFEHLHQQLNPHYALAENPRLPFNRDLAIAHRMFVLYGTADPAPAVFRWMTPGGSVFGYNAGDEGKMVSQISEQGLTLYPSDWAENLCATSAGASEPTEPLPRFTAFDPSHIDWTDHRPANAFLLSDGDNDQWMITSFAHNKDFWASPDKGTFPFAFGIEAFSLQQAAPAVLDDLTRTQPANTSVVQASGGYFYPDLFGANLSGAEQERLLAARGRELNTAMHRSNVRVLIVYCMKLNSPAAKRAFATLAAQLDDAAGILAIQYFPYAGGNGEVFWARDHAGRSLPIVTAKFDIWADTQQKNTGTPAQVAGFIQSAAAAAPASSPLLCWTIQHAWSNFGTNDDPERGVSPSLDCTHRLGDAVHTVSIEELLWRIRMRHDPTQTQAALAAWQP